MEGLVLLLLLGLQGCAKKVNASLFSECATASPNVTNVTQSVSITHITHCNSELAGTLDHKVVAFGSLTGLLLVILILIFTGWMWTCWTLKKKKEEIQRHKICHKRESDSEEERFCPNPIYKMTTTQPVVGTAIEQPLDSLEESGQSINGLSSKDNKGYCGVNRAVENIYTSSEGSSHSSLQEEQEVNRVEEGETEEKHVYHVLEKPGCDDYEEPDKNFKENTAMKYETLMPLNEF